MRFLLQSKSIGASKTTFGDKRLALLRMTCCAGLILAYGTSASRAELVEAPSVQALAGGSFVGLPENILPAVAMLRSRLEQVGAQGGVTESHLAAADNFLKLLRENPGIFSQEVPALGKDQRAVYTEAAKQGLIALESLSGISAVLAQKDWVTQVDPALAEMIQQQCGRRTMDERDLFENARILLDGVATPDEESRNLLTDLDQTGRECAASLARLAEAAAKQLQTLENEINSLTQRLETETDPAERNRIAAEIEQKREEQRQIEQDSGLIGLLTFLSGLASFAAGVASVIATGGTCVPCYAQIAGGAAALQKGYEMMEGKAVTVTETVPARYPGIDPARKPDEAKRTDAENELNADDRFTYIPPETEGGNFLIARKETGDIVVFQIEPERQITIELDKVEFSGATDNTAVPPDDLDIIDWIRVDGSLSIQPTEISFTLVGQIKGQEVEVSFIQSPVDEPFLVTAQKR